MVKATLKRTLQLEEQHNSALNALKTVETSKNKHRRSSEMQTLAHTFDRGRESLLQIEVWLL